jgi:hypothetical protein
MKEEIFETVLNEILEELRKSNKSLDSLIKSNESASSKVDIESVKKEIGTARADVATARGDVANVQKEIADSREDISNLRADIGKLRENIIDICKDTRQLIMALETYRKAIPPPPDLRPIIRQFRITLFGGILLVAIATIIFFATPYKLYQDQPPPIQPQDTPLPPPPPTINKRQSPNKQQPPNKQQSPPHQHISGHRKNNSDTLHKKDIYEIADSLLKATP